MSQDRHPTEDLPAYALGVLDRDESEVVAAHVETCGACARDLAQFGEVVSDIAAIGSAEAVEPPRGLRTRIVLRHRDAPVPSATSWGDRLVEFLLRPVPAAVPAALAVLLVAAFVAVGVSRQQADTYERALAGVVDGRVVALAPTGANPNARGAVVIPARGSPYLVARLPAPPPGKVWEAWVLRPGASGPTAVPAGTTERGDVVTLSLTVPLGEGDGVAITLESAGGAAQPTTEPILVADRT